MDLIWKPVQEKMRFVLVLDGAEAFVLMCSDLTLSAQDIIKAHSYAVLTIQPVSVIKILVGIAAAV